ncbi:DUF3772 domain-containing protein [Nereida sp. MMG025]|uniref:DUF3772 domain-containing protein n=1 Tax=Nereida sp. MMG025 TaxID=2909981 RepID=UPI001F29BAEA|nr:DUF3772 domain-containing protein [Nereida sp. MMG025]MCF6443418.1 DUF3772 domain-containing protein [Nereida sp. MMG025]
MAPVFQALWLALWIACASATGALAQTTPSSDVALAAEDYTAFRNFAAEVEGALEQDRATSLLEAMRTELATWRAQFVEAQTENAARIDNVRDQLDVLGPPPEEGETESEDIADRREALNTQLNTLRAPVIAAEQANTQADGLISEIDQVIRERQAEALFSSGASPLDPSNWATASRAVIRTTERMGAEVTSALGNRTRLTEVASKTPEILFYLALALILLLRGRFWMEQLANRFIARGYGLASFVISLGQMLLPILGLVALSRALLATDLVGLRGYILVDALPVIGVFVFVARWLGNRMFPKVDDGNGLAQMSPDDRTMGRRVFSWIGGVLCVPYLISSFGSFEGWSDATLAVLQFPVILGLSVLFFLFARLLRGQIVSDGDESDEAPRLKGRVWSLLATALTFAAIAGPVLAAIGYMAAAVALVYPTAYSLGLMAMLWIAQQVVGGIYTLVTRKPSDALIPILIGFGLVILSLPLFALIWGARLADLTELWTQFRQGFQFGETRISPTNFLTFAIVFVVGYTLTRLFQGTLKTNVLPKTQIDKGGQNAITSGVGYVGIFLAALIAITTAGIDLSGLAIVAGALSVGIGFGLQNIVSNFVSGIILLIERPISEGDWIEVGGQMGYVRDISVRSTRIETFDRTDVIVPNADLVSGTVTNYTRGNTVGRVIVPVGVAYGTDTKKVEKILMDIVTSHPMVLLNPAPAVVFQGFGADSMDFEIRGILRDVNWVLSVKSEMNHTIAQRFAEEGIEIPFAQRDVWLRNPETLNPQGDT